jgi:hypothetical protein
MARPHRPAWRKGRIIGQEKRPLPSKRAYLVWIFEPPAPGAVLIGMIIALRVDLHPGFCGQFKGAKAITQMLI